MQLLHLRLSQLPTNGKITSNDARRIAEMGEGDQLWILTILERS